MKRVEIAIKKANKKNKLKFHKCGVDAYNDHKRTLKYAKIDSKYVGDQFDTITSKISTLTRIEHSDALMELFWSSKEFSENIVLENSFNLYIFWINLSKQSRPHRNLLRALTRKTEVNPGKEELDKISSMVKMKINIEIENLKVKDEAKNSTDANDTADSKAFNHGHSLK